MVQNRTMACPAAAEGGRSNWLRETVLAKHRARLRPSRKVPWHGFLNWRSVPSDHHSLCHRVHNVLIAISFISQIHPFP